jgi:hypothetical protein
VTKDRRVQRGCRAAPEELGGATIAKFRRSAARLDKAPAACYGAIEDGWIDRDVPYRLVNVLQFFDGEFRAEVRGCERGVFKL